MKTKKSTLNQLQILNLLLKHNISHFILVLAIFLITREASAQTYECGFEELSGETLFEMDQSNCDPADYDWICLRIKLHYLNNTSDPSVMLIVKCQR